MASTTGGYTHAKAKARKPRAFYMGGIAYAMCLDGTNGTRHVWFTTHIAGHEHSRVFAARFARWMTAAAAWCAEGGRR